MDKITAKDMIRAYKLLFKKLGRSPTYVDLSKYGLTKHFITSAFGNLTALQTAAKVKTRRASLQDRLKELLSEA